jgi:hypothetical protein
MQYMDAISKIILLVGLIKANRYFKPHVCAIIYGFGAFSLAFTHFNGTFLMDTVKAVLAGFASWYMFYKLKEADDLSEKWFATLAIGGAVLLFVL